MGRIDSKMKREPYPPRTILLCGVAQQDMALKLLTAAPLDGVHPLEFVLREQVKARGLDQNARMWVGPLADIAEQAYVNGRTYSAEVWHEQFKREYLPEDDDPELVLLVTKPEVYHKYSITPNGDRVLIGSTTQLSKRGMALYLEQVYAFGGNLGVQFHAAPGD